jgi:CelD/BcsL family acetyltransferase involved in cellulose biosynthesis
MHIDIIDDFSAIADLKSQWDSVYDSDPDAQFFLSSTWIFHWMSVALTQRIVLAARPGPQGSDYVAFFPLRFRTLMKKGGGFYNVLDMACQGIADYTGFIGRPEHDGEVVPAFVDAIRQFAWTKLDLSFLRTSQARTDLLLKGFPAKEFRIRDESPTPPPGQPDHAICPYVELPGDWEAYLSGHMSANSRQRARRLLKRVDEATDLSITYADATSYERDIDTLLQFWDTKWSMRRGRGVDAIVNIVREMMRHCFREDALLLPTMWQGDNPVCSLALLIDRRKMTYLFFMTGRDDDFEGPSPGFVLHAHAIRHAIANGFTTYDFLQGNDAYKYSFGVKERTVMNRTVAQKSQQAGLDRRCLGTVLAKTRALHRQGMLAEAERGYRQIIRLDPRDSGALFGLGNLLAGKGNRAQAEKYLKAAADLEPPSFGS